MHQINAVQRVAGKAVIEFNRKILILHPSKIDTNKNWHIPGGIREDINESLLETAIREVREETGIELKGMDQKILKIGEWFAVDKGENVKILAVFYHFFLTEEPQVKLSEEHDDFKWIDSGNYSEYDTNGDIQETILLLYGK